MKFLPECNKVCGTHLRYFNTIILECSFDGFAAFFLGLGVRMVSGWHAWSCQFAPIRAALLSCERTRGTRAAHGSHMCSASCSATRPKPAGSESIQTLDQES